jgi:hypothetical protein
LVTVEYKLLITKEINAIVIDYIQKVNLRKLLIAFNFELTNDYEVVTDIIQSLNFYGIDAKPKEKRVSLQ